MKEMVSMEEMPPTFTVGEDILPEIKKWKNGNKYTVTLNVRQVGSYLEDFGKKKGKLEARFEIIGGDGESLVKKELEKRV